MGNSIKHSVEGKNRPNQVGILQNPDNAEKILSLTADTMFLLSKEGICVDFVLHTDRWFLQDGAYILGKNLFDLLPLETSKALKINFDKVVSTGKTSNENYELKLSEKNFFFKCIINIYSDDLILCQYRDITQRVMLKNRLEVINQKLQEIEKVAQIGQWIYNINLNEFQYSGYSGALAVDGKTKYIGLDKYTEYIHPEDRNIFKDFINDGFNLSIDKFIDYRLILNKKLFHFRLKTINTYSENGMTYISGYVQNISDIMQKKHELEMVTLAVENSTDYIFSMKTDGQLVFGNRKYKDFNGINVDEDITKYNFFEIRKKSPNKTRWIDIIQQLTSSNQTINFVEPHPIPDKPEIIAFDCTSYLVQDSNDDNLIWTFGKDITERVHYEKQVKELNQIMSTVLENIPMSISVKDVKDDFKYIFSNRIGDEFHWGVKDRMIGKTDAEIYPKEVADLMRAEDLANTKSKLENRKIIEDIDEFGEKQIRDQLKIVVKDDSRPLLISIERDITKDKLMEQELIDAKEKAEQSDKLKSAFIANMSHEIRTPLNAIVGFSRIIAETSNSEERLSYYSIVEANNIRLLGLINEILDISKIESGIMEFDYEPMSIYAVCNDLLQNNTLRCSKEIKLILDDSDPDLIINCDKNRLVQVFNNLIGNSIKFTKQGSIHFGYVQKADQIEFHVTDTGSGISADQIDRVFLRFVKADSYSQGTGLGLSICKSILEKMGGTIRVESSVGVGSTFYFSLPNSCIVKHVADKETSSSDKTEDKIKKGLILIAEDTDSNYTLLEAMIGKMYTLKRAKNGLEAVNMFEELKPDLILMDIKLPVMNGLDSTRIIRTISANVPIIAQSAFAFDEDRKHSIESGCNDFLAKPFKKKQLVEAIGKYLK